MHLSPRELALLGAALVVVTLIVTRVVAARARSWRSRRRNERAGRGERRAERLLRRAGYRVKGRQVCQDFTFYVDGRPYTVELRADLLVRRRGRTFVAEVKTGARAPHPDHGPTRRQLLEYAVAFDADGLLLVDPERRAIREVVFPLPG